MKRTLITSSLLALVSATLISCGGGGSDGITTTAASSATPAIATAGATDVAALSSSAMSNLSISGSVQGVAINSPPVVTFQLLNSDNNTALTGLEQWTVKKASDVVPAYTNLSFAIAKLVPGTNGSPSKWVSYMVSTPTLVSTNGVISASAYTPSRPGSENNGTLEYLGNGQYKYTFRRDITRVPAQLANFVDTDTSKVADLGGTELAYDPNAVHRLVIQISGAVRGSTTSSTSTSCNTPDGTCASGATYEFIRTPVDLVYDWIPATGRVVKPTDTDVEQREIVNVAACASCHNKFTFHGGNEVKGWGGGRQETRQCVVCHTDQRKFGRTGQTAINADGDFSDNLALDQTGKPIYTKSTYTINGISRDNNQSLFDFPVFIHKIHMGEELLRKGYNPGVKLNEVKYPQLITNCAKCHSGDTTKPDGSANTVAKLDGTVVQMATPQGNNWYTKPSRQACGACHDGINFNDGTGTTLATGHAPTGHGAGLGGAQLNDSQCATCHNATAIKKMHVSVTPQDFASTLFSGGTNGNTNAAWLAANPNNLPDGAIKVTYEIKSVARNTSKQPEMVFRILQNGVPVAFNPAPISDFSNKEMWDNFMGAPSAYFVFAVPQDGITAPADFNASVSGYLRSIWNGKATGAGAGSLIADPSNPGYYKVTLTGVTIPDSAVMLTGGLGYSYAPASTMPLTQTNLTDYPVATATGVQTTNMPNKTGGLIVVAPDVQAVASSGAAAGGTGGAYVGRRAIVEDKRCNNCHQELGAFNQSQFHAGQRNDGSTCSWCHTPNRTSSGWSADSTNFIHGIHGSAKRKVNFTWHAASTTDGYWTIGYPGVLRNCEACHLPGSYDFSNASAKSAAGLPTGGAADKRLFRYSATGIFNGTVGTANKSWSGSACTANQSATTPTVQTDLALYSISPFVTKDNTTSYGLGFTFVNPSATASTKLCDPDNNGAVITVTAGTTREASPTALLESPTSTVCFACHDDETPATGIKASLGGVTARQHMEANGGKIYAARGAGNPAQTETCLTQCHGPTSAANIRAVHAK